MPTIGLDCQLILDGTGYFIEPGSFTLHRPRVRRAEHTRQPASGSAGAGERYLDMGPGKREWVFTVVAYQSIRTYAGQLTATTGQQYRDALHTSYQKVNTTLSFTDPAGTVWSVRFDDLIEQITDVRSQADGEIQYLLRVTLVEA
jgi:hypothetical protein